MDILIVSKSGFGKSNMGDIIRNTIFKLDSDSTVNSGDPDRSMKYLGHGSNVYNITVRQLRPEENLSNLTKEELENDIVVYIGSKRFSEWFETVYQK